jgi:L-ascorbate metabolism protein UlaG (beta-lactamase superfamily)
MKISKYIHSCILVESKKERLLIDPGPFTFIEGKVKAGDFKGLTTILFTHKLSLANYYRGRILRSARARVLRAV